MPPKKRKKSEAQKQSLVTARKVLKEMREKAKNSKKKS